MNKEILSLINLKTEGAYWDFKQEWHSNNVDLLHDIICMANNLEDCDAYIIIGVTDSGDICGVPETNRKNQQSVIDFLREKKFAGGVRPIVYVQCLDIEGKTVDVIIIKNTANTPYYLTEDFQGLYKGNIYTRVIDTNTPKNSHADIDKVEWLWKKRFGLIGNLERKIKRILIHAGWLCEDAGEYDEHFFNEFYPEIRIDANQDEAAFLTENCTAHDSFFYLYANHRFWNWSGQENLRRKCYSIRWYGNRVRQFYTINAPRMDFDFVEPESAFLSNSIGILLDKGFGLSVPYAYFVKDSIEYMVFKMILSFQIGEEVMLTKYGNFSDVFCLDVIPTFENANEHSTFMNYVLENREQFKSDYEDSNLSNDMYSGAEANKDTRIKQSFRLGKLLVEWLEQWRGLE